TGLAAWWDSFSGPEFFPQARAPQLAPAGQGVLLWDGDCGFCRRVADVLKKIALRPLEMRPFQEVLPQLPAEILPWTTVQMHWVRPDGAIVGGSQALIEILEAANHRLTSGLLESPLLRPVTWLGYRLVARNRG